MKIQMNVKTSSTITCPLCGNKASEAMPEDSCHFFWECPGCGEIIKPKQGDCCVFCSYGDADCPPVKQNKSCY
ncbi:GDCCVxC domain-containing (seleno)protein [Gracilimonas halophila]|uniref:GDCCVxC domain-containing (Seleno)protein n=1 Tax=Gracilimonas halophila TaxID=1834464 RepID=A0ABW5JGV0_9BACT